VHAHELGRVVDADPLAAVPCLSRHLIDLRAVTDQGAWMLVSSEAPRRPTTSAGAVITAHDVEAWEVARGHRLRLRSS
jgi:hypothetical protein